MTYLNTDFLGLNLPRPAFIFNKIIASQIIELIHKTFTLAKNFDTVRLKM